MHNYRELKVWQKAIEFCTDMYKATASFPNSELYGLTTQLKKATISIGSNIAEGAGRNTDKEFAQFLNYAYGSTSEVDTQLIIARNLEFLENEEFNVLQGKLNEIQKMLFSLKNQLKTLNTQY